jgi:hypothetical protein
MFRKNKLRSDVALQDAIVTSDSVKRKRTLDLHRWAPAKHALPSKPVLIGIGVLAFVFIVPALYFLSLWAGDALHHDKATFVCSDALIKEANQNMTTHDLTGMTKVAEKVGNLKRHETDVNCEYILVNYAVETGNVTDARTQLTLLKQQYKASYSPLFTQPTLSPDELTTLIDTTAATQKADSEEGAQAQDSLGKLDSEADKLGPGAKK